ncbi:hypothetical protein SS05631_c31510 [Sinorhizobium sp. CCBAU 05631]|nr:hypothetical protein SS05631_c31510 [Sinorhizobium sp. CCBAU 05631]
MRFTRRSHDNGKKNPLFNPLRAGLHAFIASLKQKTAT